MSLLFNLVSWPMFGIALLIFGFAPSLLLRVIVLAFPRDDPRRDELLGELYAVPRFERPFWVAEQFEVALVEGAGQRLVWAATGRIIHRWHLGSGVRRNREHPDAFWIPSDEERQAVESGMKVKLMFEMRDGWGERMWVQVTAVKKRKLVGELFNLPIGIPRLMPGDKIKFKREHIIDIVEDSDVGASVGGDEEDSDEPRPQLVHDGCNGHAHHEEEPDSETERTDPPTSPPPSSSPLPTSR
jgi:uncharacterized protein YegJ (DUF2314 family)